MSRPRSYCPARTRAQETALTVARAAGGVVKRNRRTLEGLGIGLVLRAVLAPIPVVGPALGIAALVASTASGLAHQLRESVEGPD